MDYINEQVEDFLMEELNHLQMPPKPKIDQNPPNDYINEDMISSWLDLPFSIEHDQEYQHHISQLPQVQEEVDHEEDLVLSNFNPTTTTPATTTTTITTNFHNLLPIIDDEEPPFLLENLFDFQDHHGRTSSQEQNALTSPPYPLLQLHDHSHHVEPVLSEDADEYYKNMLFLNDDELMSLVNINTTENTTIQVNSTKDDLVNAKTTSNNDNGQAGTSSQSKKTNGNKIRRRCKDNDKGDESTMEGVEDDTKLKTSSCGSKNLISERNRRNRLSQQLLALRSLVPNITKMDKRSVLLDALAYLRKINEETTFLQMELKDHTNHHPLTTAIATTGTAATTTRREESFADDNIYPLESSAPSDAASKSNFIITEVETEKVEKRRYIVKITTKCTKKGEIGAGGEILRVIESLGFDITFTSLLQKNAHQLQKQQEEPEILIVIFIKVNKGEKMEEGQLKDCISKRAMRFGLNFQNP